MNIEPDANEVFPNLWLGNYKSSQCETFLKKHNINCIFTIMQINDNVFNKFNNITYFQLDIRDKMTCSKKDYYIIINTIITTIYYLLKNNKNILIHCKNGHHRSAVITAAFLIKYCNYSYKNAIEYINSLRHLSLRRSTCMSEHLFRFYNNLNKINCNYYTWKKNNNYCYALCKK